jgi:hypothetical protein
MSQVAFLPTHKHLLTGRYTGLTNKKKGELIDICEELGLSTDGTVPELRTTIQNHIQAGGSPPHSKGSTARKTR